jgi:hypothetical protein
MNQQQLPQVSELTDSDISASSGLETFDTSDTDADVCRLYHRDVVGAVADGEQDRGEVTFH